MYFCQNGNSIHNGKIELFFSFSTIFFKRITVLRNQHGKRSGWDLSTGINTLRPRRNEQPFAYDIFKCIFFNENVIIYFKVSLKFVPKGPINNIPALVQIMAWRRSGDKPLSEPMMVSLTTHICIARPQ